VTVETGMTDAAIAPAKRIIDAVIEAETALRASGVTDVPRLEAEVLLADLLGVGRAALIASYTRGMGPRAEYFSRISMRLKGEPVAYIIGKKEFMGFTFRVDRRALIPRPETETLVCHAVEAARANGTRTIVDMGTGCGCIAVSLALLLPEADIHATDTSVDALDLARYNAELHCVDRQVMLHSGNIFSALPLSLKGRVDMIVSNPPYISDAEYRALERGIREFEPSIALRGGIDGLEIFRQIAAGAADILSCGGILAIEIGESQGESAAEILENTASFANVKTVCDLAGRTRVITCRKTR